MLYTKSCMLIIVLQNLNPCGTIAQSCRLINDFFFYKTRRVDRETNGQQLHLTLGITVLSTTELIAQVIFNLCHHQLIATDLSPADSILPTWLILPTQPLPVMMDDVSKSLVAGKHICVGIWRWTLRKCSHILQINGFTCITSGITILEIMRWLISNKTYSLYLF